MQSCNFWIAVWMDVLMKAVKLLQHMYRVSKKKKFAWSQVRFKIAHLLATFHRRNRKCHALIGQLKSKLLEFFSKHFMSDNKAAKKWFKLAVLKRFKMSRKGRKRFGHLKQAAKVEKENLVHRKWLILLPICSSGWNMQICLDNLLHYCLYVCVLVIKIYFCTKIV